MSETSEPLSGEDKTVFESAEKLLVETGRDIFDEEIAADANLLVSDVRAALLSLADAGRLEVTPREDESITVTGVVV